ncbi:MAG: GyrI-like domain-containing protein [Fimbriimonadales bacterium]
MGNYEIVDVPEMAALVRRATCANTQIGPAISRLYGEIMAGNPDAELEGPPCLFYLRWGPENCDIEAALPVAPTTIPAPGTELKTYPACRAVTTEHVGSYEGLAQAWMNLWSHITASKLDAVGTPWDCYVTDPGEEPDPNQWVTELYVPVI